MANGSRLGPAKGLGTRATSTNSKECPLLSQGPENDGRAVPPGLLARADKVIVKPMSPFSHFRGSLRVPNGASANQCHAKGSMPLPISVTTAASGLGDRGIARQGG
jgi:hypothetical protein